MKKPVKPRQQYYKEDSLYGEDCATLGNLNAVAKKMGYTVNANVVHDDRAGSWYIYEDVRLTDQEMEDALKKYDEDLIKYKKYKIEVTRKKLEKLEGELA